MSKLNLLISLLSFDDKKSGNDPQLAHLDWSRKIKNLDVDLPESRKQELTPGETVVLFNNKRTTSIDGTSEFDLTNLTASTYRVKWTGVGTAPVFRTERALSTDATSEITITKNNNATMTFTASGGTLADFSAVLIGDTLRLEAPFTSANRGSFTVIAKTATSLTIKRSDGVEETVVLGASFASAFRVYSSAGVQKGDKLIISGGFSLASHDTYEVTDVAPDFIDFVSTEAIPEESGVVPGAAALTIYSDAKRFLYMEADRKSSVKINDSAEAIVIEPIKEGSTDLPGLFLMHGTIFKVELENTSLESSKIFHVTVE